MSRDDEDDLTPLARAMRNRKRPSITIAWPAIEADSDLAGVKVALVNPSDEELAEAQAATTQYLKNTLRLDEFQLSIMLERNLFQAEEQRQILARVLRDPSNVDLSFAKVDELREHMTPDVRGALMRKLEAFVESRNPERRFNGDPEEVRNFVQSLKDDGALSEYLTSCDSATLIVIARSLADLLPTRTKPSSTDTYNSNSPNGSSSVTTSDATKTDG